MAGENIDNDEEKQLDIPYQRTINGVNPWKRAIITVAGVTFNFIFALIMLAIFIFFNGVSTDDNTIKVASNSYASQSGLSSGDKIVALKDIRIIDNKTTVVYEDSDCIDKRCETNYFNSIKVYLDNDQIDTAINKYLENNPNANLTQEVTVIFTHKGTNGENSTSLIREYNNETKSFPLYGLEGATRVPGFFEGIGLTFKTFGRIIGLMFKAIGSLFTPEGFNSLGGVVSMYKSSSEMAKEGILSYIWYIAIISVNLGFFNLLPIPALDGARFYVSIIEGITKKKLNPKIEGYLNMAGLIVLFSLMIVVTIKDIVGLF